MKLVKIQCQTCGAEMVQIGDRHYKCNYCGMTYEAKESLSDDLIHALRSAALTKKKCKFDEAIKEYEDILEQSPECIEAFWGALMADAGISYSSKNNEASPIFYKLNKNRITTNNYYNQLSNYATNEEKKVYSNRILEIDALRVKINSNIDDIKPEVVICTIDDSTSKDYSIGLDLLNKLKSKNINVFFTALQLSKESYSNYEIKLFPALFNAKLLVIISSNVENVRQDYIESAWKRYKLMEHCDNSERELLFYPVDSKENIYPFELRKSKILNEKNAVEIVLDFLGKNPNQSTKKEKVIESTKKQEIETSEKISDIPNKEVNKTEKPVYKEKEKPYFNQETTRSELRNSVSSSTFSSRNGSYDRIDTNPDALFQIADKVKNYNIAQLNLLRSCLSDLGGLSYEWDDKNIYQIILEMNNIIQNYEGLIPEANNFAEWLEQKAHMLLKNRK